MFIDLNAKRLLQDLADQSRRAADPTPLMRDLALVMEEAIAQNFDTEGRGEWPPLSPNFPRPGGKILQQSGILSGSITSRYDATEAVAGTADIRAATHQFGARQGEYGTTSRGAPIPFGDIPAREFLKLYDSDIEEMEELTADFLSP